jgi:eukaryotic-like serine/threonine-protein kinase
MPASVTLTICCGPHTGRVFRFDERTTCVMGRSEDCQPRLPDDLDHASISRHHCLIDINPPDIRIRDFGSLNGTFVNGHKIGQREEGQTAEEGARGHYPECDLADGDEVSLGETVFRVGVSVPVSCARCGAELPETAPADRPTGPPLCPGCAADTVASCITPAEIRDARCAQCGRAVPQQAGPRHPGVSVCAACQNNPQGVLQRLLDTADEGQEGILAIRGYRVIKELGRGGMGAVFLARHGPTGDTVALKVMLPRVAAGNQARERFLREIELTKVLRHPNVVQLREAGCSHGTFFFTLEYCDGGSVDDLLERRGPLPAAEACGLVLQALDGLDYAHNVFGPGKGLVHRDLKPSNLLLAGTGDLRRVKVADYGLSKAFDQAGLSGQTCTGTLAGTPLFIPRQQVINFKYARPEVDVWAMAATLYYLLTGLAPRDFRAVRDPWQVVLQTDAVPIRRRNPSVPKALARVIDQALIDRPAIVFQTAAEFKENLEEAGR